MLKRKPHLFTSNEKVKNPYECLAEERAPISESFFKDYIHHELIKAIFIINNGMNKFQLFITINNSKGGLLLTGTRKKPREWSSLNNLYSFLKSSGITNKIPVLLYFGRIDNGI